MGHVIFYDEKFKWGSRKPHHVNAFNWFDLNDYILYEFDNSKFNKLRKDNKLSKLRRWMQNNLLGEVIIQQDEHSGISLYFENKHDFLAFKLKWC